MTELTIREETGEDGDAIAGVTVEAFRTLDVSNQTEHFIVEALRDADALSVSLVAELDGRVVGHIAFSPVAVSDGTSLWYALGPVSVLPELQRKGIGGALVREGLDALKARGARGCCLVGHPEYYGRFGFRNPSELACDGVPADAFFALAFDGQLPQGTVAFHDAFQATG